MKAFYIFVTCFHVGIMIFLLYSCIGLFKSQRQHKKTMKAFCKIKDVMDKGIADSITPQQLYFRLIQAREQFDAKTIEETRINTLINDLKLIK